MSISYNPDVYAITEPTWELVASSPGEAVYSYSSEGQMISVEMGQDAEFTVGMKVIAEEAIMRVPETLRDDTRNRFSRMSPEEVAEIVLGAIDEVDHGSVEPLDLMVKKRMKSI